MGINYIIQKPQQSIKRILCMMVSLSLPAMAAAAPVAESVQATSGTHKGMVATPQKGVRKVLGIVTDTKTGEPIIGANVLVRGTKTGTVTDIDGKFEIKASAQDVLEISYLGYASKAIKADNVVLSITLAESSARIDEVVITAHGTGQKKETVTGAIQMIRPSELKMPGSNLSSAFAGRIAGLISYSRSGQPGADGSDFFIRGIATTSGVTRPLIILDGVEVSAGDLNALDTEVLESYSILKDASATAMYGSRGANGVIIVKTKSGQDLDRPIINVRLENYFNTPTSIPKLASGETYMRMFNEAVTNQGTGALLYSDERIQGVREGKDPYLYPNVDWYKEIFKDYTWNQRANMSIRGGTSKITYFMNLNVTHETGMLKGRSKDFFSYDNNINLMKYAFQNNINFKVSSKAHLALNLNVQMRNFRGPVTSSNGGGGVGAMFGSIMNTSPVDFPVRFPQDNDPWIHWGSDRRGLAVIDNPVAVASSGYSDDFESTVLANLSYNQNLDIITKGLNFKGLFSFKNWSRSMHYRFQPYNKYRLTKYEVNEDGTYPLEAVGGEPTKPNLGAGGGTDGDRKFYFEALLNWSRTFGHHNIGAMAIYNQDEFNVNVYNSDIVRALPKRRQNLSGRLTYDYAHRYMLEVNAAYSGSENFAAGHRFGFFPAVSAGWAVSEEGFWKGLKKIIPLLKLRASYGMVGNDQIGGARFIYRPIVNLNGLGYYRTGFGGQNEQHSGPNFTRLENTGISWEIARKFNAGIDLKLFKGLSITADIFREVRSDIFQQRTSIPDYLGAAGIEVFGNFSKMENKGFDATIEYFRQFNKDFSLQVRGTFNYAHNTILERDEAPGLRKSLSWIGRSANMYLGYVANGLYADEADVTNNPRSTLGNIAIKPGDIKYVDQPDNDGNYDGVINSDDRQFMGYPTVPEIQYGITFSAVYKKFDFSMLWQGQTNVSLMMSGIAPFGTEHNRNVLQWVADNYWSPENPNPNATFPRLTHHNNSHNEAGSSYWLRDASFLKLRSMEVGFRYKLARFYVSATNLLTIAPFKEWDPEMGGGRGMSYPLQRTFNIGLQLTFK